MSLDKKIQLTDYATLIALTFTLFAGIFSFYFKTEQNKFLKEQRNKDLVAIAEANENAENSKKESALAIKESSIATENAALSKEKAALAELKSKELEKELLKLRLAVADRFLPEFTKISLKDKLKKFSKKDVLINCNISNNNEPINFSIELNNFFESIGWNSNVSNNYNVIIPAPTGIKLFVSQENVEIANIIITELKAIGYECELIFSTSNNAIIFQVNSK